MESTTTTATADGVGQIKIFSNKIPKLISLNRLKHISKLLFYKNPPSSTAGKKNFSFQQRIRKFFSLTPSQNPMPSITVEVRTQTVENKIREFLHKIFLIKKKEGGIVQIELIP